MWGTSALVGRSALESFLDANPAFKSLWRAKHWVIGASLVTGVLAYALALLLPTQCAGSTTILIGSLGAGGMTQQPLEPPGIAASRFSSESFKREVLKAANLRADHPDGMMAMRSLAAKARPEGSSIDVRVVATSPEGVVNILNAAASALATLHEAHAARRLESLRDQMMLIHDDLQELDKMLAAQAGPAKHPGYEVVAAHIFSLYEKSRLKQLERAIKERLRLTEPTRAVAPPSVSVRPMHRLRLRYAAIASIATFVVLVTLILLLVPGNSPRQA
jgi:hypothetical protein